MQANFTAYLEAKGFPPKAVAARVAEAARVERHYGDLDSHYAEDRLASVIAALTYTLDDERRGRPNPSCLAIGDDLRASLDNFRSAVELYGFFCCDNEDGPRSYRRRLPATPRPIATPVAAADERLPVSG